MELVTLLNTKEKLQSDKEAVELETMKVENIGKKKKDFTFSTFLLSANDVFFYTKSMDELFV